MRLGARGRQAVQVRPPQPKFPAMLSPMQAGQTSLCYDGDFYPFGGERIVTNTCAQNYKFTGKERDLETGNDNFGARYVRSNLGRFMSPDSTGYSSLANPQAWNLYAYTLNNPLKYIDPSGHTVECRTSAQQCQAAIAAATANAEAAKRVATNTVTTRHSFLGKHWTTTKTTIAITGDISSFRALGQNASRLADLVGSKENFTFSIRNDYLVSDLQGWRGDNANLFNSTLPFGGGFTQTPSMTGNPDGNVFVKPDPSSEDPESTYEGIPGANIGETAAHELLGHLWGEVFAGHMIGTAENKQDAVNAENAVRNTDPSRGQKEVHDHGQVRF